MGFLGLFFVCVWQDNSGSACTTQSYPLELLGNQVIEDPIFLAYLYICPCDRRVTPLALKSVLVFVADFFNKSGGGEIFLFLLRWLAWSISNLLLWTDFFLI